MADAIARHGTRVVTVLGNIGDPAAVAEMSRRITAELGTVDILVNCAGGDIGSKGGKPNPNNALDIALEDIQVETNNNLIGTLLVSQTFVRPMRDRGIGLRHQHRVRRRAHGRDARGRLLDAEGGGRALHPLPGAGDAAARRAGQRGQPRADEDRPLPGDPHDRPGDDGDRTIR